MVKAWLKYGQAMVQVWLWYGSGMVQVYSWSWVNNNLHMNELYLSEEQILKAETKTTTLPYLLLLPRATKSLSTLCLNVKQTSG